MNYINQIYNNSSAFPLQTPIANTCIESNAMQPPVNDYNYFQYGPLTTSSPGMPVYPQNSDIYAIQQNGDLRNFSNMNTQLCDPVQAPNSYIQQQPMIKQVSPFMSPPFQQQHVPNAMYNHMYAGQYVDPNSFERHSMGGSLPGPQPIFAPYTDDFSRSDSIYQSNMQPTQVAYAHYDPMCYQQQMQHPIHQQPNHANNTYMQSNSITKIVTNGNIQTSHINQNCGSLDKNVIGKVRNNPSYLNRREKSVTISSSKSDCSDNATCLSKETAIDLLITNLDYNIAPKEWKKILFSQLQSTIKNVHQVNMQTRLDGSVCAIIKMGNLADARLAISHFHRKKIGYKRIHVNIINSTNNSCTQTLKQEVVGLLKSVAGNSLSVCKFMELFICRYHRSISISDLYKLRDVVEMRDVDGNQNGRLVVLINNTEKELPKINTNQTSEIVDSPICQIHCKEGTKDYITTIESCNLPSVVISLSTLKPQLHQLLHTHNGSIPLMSFPVCYRSEFGEFITALGGNCSEIEENNLPITGSEASLDQKIFSSTNTSADIKDDGSSENLNTKSEDSEDNNVYSSGVGLEHLITCVAGVVIIVSPSGVQKIQWEDNQEDVDFSSSATNSINATRVDDTSSTNHWSGNHLVDRLHQFGREVVELLKHQSGCRVLLNKFIPTYHHYFGKQCRVADYGYSKLNELVDAVPHVVHVMGSGNLRFITLAHKVQVRRFTNELVKILKSQATKSCRLSEFSLIYERIFKKPFRIVDYGVCFLEDILEDIPSNTVEIIMDGQEAVLSVPKRIQTQEEKERTSHFSMEVVDLLKHSPRCRLLFNKFIPSYHHHFSRQCKVSDYGFSKLVELLEAVSCVAKIIEESQEKYVTLTRREQLRVLAEQTLNLLETSPSKRILLKDWTSMYMKHNGYAPNLEDHGVETIEQLIGKVPRIARIESSSNSGVKATSSTGLPNTSGTKEDSNVPERGDGEISSGSFDKQLYICLADRTHIKHLAHKVLLVLLEVADGNLSGHQFYEKFRCMYRDEPNMQEVENELFEIVEIITDQTHMDNFTIKLKPLILMSRDIRDLLRTNQGKIPLFHIESMYLAMFGRELVPHIFGYPSLLTLLQSINFVVTVYGRGVRASVMLCQDFLGKLSYKVAYSHEAIMDANDIKIECKEKENMARYISTDNSGWIPTTATYSDTHMYSDSNIMQMSSMTSDCQEMYSSTGYTHMVPVQYPMSYGFSGAPGFLPPGQDQKQLDELVERLAYDGSSIPMATSTIPGPSSVPINYHQPVYGQPASMPMEYTSSAPSQFLAPTPFAVANNYYSPPAPSPGTFWSTGVPSAMYAYDTSVNNLSMPPTGSDDHDENHQGDHISPFYHYANNASLAMTMAPSSQSCSSISSAPTSAQISPRAPLLTKVSDSGNKCDPSNGDLSKTTYYYYQSGNDSAPEQVGDIAGYHVNSDNCTIQHHTSSESYSLQGIMTNLKLETGDNQDSSPPQDSLRKTNRMPANFDSLNSN